MSALPDRRKHSFFSIKNPDNRRIQWRRTMIVNSSGRRLDQGWLFRWQIFVLLVFG
jgi:hypothetical protein